MQSDLRRVFWVACIAGAAACLGAVGCGGGSLVLDLDGAPVDPLADIGAASVLAFVTSECPISNQYLPELRRIEQAFQAKAVRFWLVYPSRLDSVEKIRAHVAEFGTGMRALRDPEHRLVRRAGVTVTPEVAVFDSRQRITYAGRIDDRYAALGVSSVAAHVHDLADALRALSLGKPPARPRTDAVGCSISE